MKGKLNTHRRIAFFLLTLFTIYYVNIVMFTHLHVLDGVPVIHAHPFHDGTHSHSAAECIFIAYLSTAHFVIEEISLFSSVRTKLLAVLQPIYESFFSIRIYLSTSALRAPPTLF